jgi:hypothetical protein
MLVSEINGYQGTEAKQGARHKFRELILSAAVKKTGTLA